MSYVDTEYSVYRFLVWNNFLSTAKHPDSVPVQAKLAYPSMDQLKKVTLSDLVKVEKEALKLMQKLNFPKTRVDSMMAIIRKRTEFIADQLGD